MGFRSDVTQPPQSPNEEQCLVETTHATTACSRYLRRGTSEDHSTRVSSSSTTRSSVPSKCAACRGEGVVARHGARWVVRVTCRTLRANGECGLLVCYCTRRE